MRKLISILAALMVAFPVAAQELYPLSPHPEGVEWPTQGWARGTMPEEAAGDVYRLIDQAMASEKGEPMGETRAIVIIHRGQLIAEAYRDGFTANTKQMSWSMAKSVTSALAGRAVQLGLVESIDNPMPAPFPEGDPRAAITWRQWLNMTEGLDYDEISDVPLAQNDIAQMMFGTGRSDVVQYMVDELPPQDTPGEVWKYSTAAYHLIGWGLMDTFRSDDTIVYVERSFADSSFGLRYRVKFSNAYKTPENARAFHAALAAVDEEDPSDFWESISPTQRKTIIADVLWHHTFFDLLGMRYIQLEFDAAGTYLGGSNVWASAHDYAKFGYLYLRDGVWEGERLLPEGWVDFSRSKTTGKNNNTYGAGFWITAYGAEPTTAQATRSPPWDAFNANGSEGQIISIVPSRDLVIVRTGQMENTVENWNMLFEWAQEIARAFPEVERSEVE